MYPNIDMLCRCAAQLGPGNVLGWKKDMDRAFKQIVMCPSLWPLLGFMWGGYVYFDKTAIMGRRSAPYICQRVTNFIRHIMENVDYFVANYVDDFMGLETRECAW